ncbi:ABC transporter ATP-binding protein [Tepidicaulis sp.]|uniref:ABC transporter ATP-binding protein n=1 Tax=Tepidicaulis sp. TaxID=1920809 RepID=UPI003B5CB075
MVRALRTDNLKAALNERRVLRGVSLELKKGEVLGLIGPNGAGKTTLVRAVAGLIPHEGDIFIEDKPVETLARQERARLLSYLAQGAESRWPILAERLVALGRLPHLGPFMRPGAEDEAAIRRAMQRADVMAFKDRPVTRLSGGERARVMLARALAVEAPVLLVDEPTASLDPYHQLQIMEVLRSFADEGRSVIAVLHDLSLASRFCDRLALLHEGHLAAFGPPGEVLSDANLEKIYRISARRQEGERGAVVLPWARL